MSRRAPRALGVALESLAARVSPGTTLASIQRAWPTAAGGEIAAAARPVAERDGVVTIACSSAVWAQELDLMSVELVRSLNRELEGRSVSRLRCVATPPG